MMLPLSASGPRHPLVPFTLPLRHARPVPPVTNSSSGSETPVTQHLPGPTVKCHLLGEGLPWPPASNTPLGFLSRHHILFSFCTVTLLPSDLHIVYILLSAHESQEYFPLYLQGHRKCSINNCWMSWLYSKGSLALFLSDLIRNAFLKEWFLF